MVGRERCGDDFAFGLRRLGDRTPTDAADADAAAAATSAAADDDDDVADIAASSVSERVRRKRFFV